ncbi:MAG: Rieske (2Fe-2S) protein [Rubrobacteraceae bacterium]
MQRHVICKRDELKPGTVRPAKVGGRRLAIACVEEGTYRAFSDTCPHEMASLARGTVEKMWLSNGTGQLHRAEERCVIVCPWHNFEFDLETGLSPCEPERLRIKTYPATLEGDEIVVRL